MQNLLTISATVFSGMWRISLTEQRPIISAWERRKRLRGIAGLIAAAWLRSSEHRNERVHSSIPCHARQSHGRSCCRPCRFNGQGGAPPPENLALAGSGTGGAEGDRPQQSAQIRRSITEIGPGFSRKGTSTGLLSSRSQMWAEQRRRSYRVSGADCTKL